MQRGETAPGSNVDVANRAPRTAFDRDPLPGGHTVDELECDVELPARVADLVDTDDVWMAELGQRAAFAQQLLVDGAAARAQHLERDLAIELRVVRGVHDAGRALADLVEDDEPIELRADGELGSTPRRGLDELTARRGHQRRRRRAARAAGVDMLLDPSHCIRVERAQREPRELRRIGAVHRPRAYVLAGPIPGPRDALLRTNLRGL